MKKQTTPILTLAEIEPYRDFVHEKLGGKFNDIRLLITAFTRRSYVEERGMPTAPNNERLEFLGDAVLDLAVSKFLFSNYDKPEGGLSSLRDALICQKALFTVGERLDFYHLIRAGRSETFYERKRFSIIADTLEALIAAIFIDQGYNVAADFIAKHILSRVHHVIANETWRSPRSELQAYAQRKGGKPPLYRIVDEYGPDHDKTFIVDVYIKNERIATGKGSNKQSAMVDAAKNALEKLNLQRK